MPDVAATRPASGAAIESTWGQQVHDAIEGVQAATVQTTVTAVARFDVIVTFPRAYATPPTVLVSPVGGNVNLAGLVTVPTTTQVTVGLFPRAGGNLAAGPVTWGWVAVGTLA